MDEADISDERIELAKEAALRDVREQAARIPAGKPGDCDLCGEYSQRLVGGACAPCRDKYGLK
jgi:hypothetical protein